MRKADSFKVWKYIAKNMDTCFSDIRKVIDMDRNIMTCNESEIERAYERMLERQQDMFEEELFDQGEDDE